MTSFFSNARRGSKCPIVHGQLCWVRSMRWQHLMNSELNQADTNCILSHIAVEFVLIGVNGKVNTFCHRNEYADLDLRCVDYRLSLSNMYGVVYGEGHERVLKRLKQKHHLTVVLSYLG